MPESPTTLSCCSKAAVVHRVRHRRDLQAPHAVLHEAHGLDVVGPQLREELRRAPTGNFPSTEGEVKLKPGPLTSCSISLMQCPPARLQTTDPPSRGTPAGSSPLNRMNLRAWLFKRQGWRGRKPAKSWSSCHVYARSATADEAGPGAALIAPRTRMKQAAQRTKLEI